MALQEIEKAIQLDPLNTDYLFNYALLLMDIGRINDAIPILEKAKQLESNDFQFFYILGTAHCEVGNTKKVLENFKQAISIAPTSPEAHLEYAYCLIRFNNLETAHQELLIALELKPDLIDAHYYLGLLFEKQGNTILAYQQYQAFLPNASPDNPLLPDAKNRVEKIRKSLE